MIKNRLTKIRAVCDTVYIEYKADYKGTEVDRTITMPYVLDENRIATFRMSEECLHDIIDIANGFQNI